MREEFEALWRDVVSALHADSIYAIVDPLQGCDDLTCFLLPLQAKAFENLVSGNFGGVFFEIRFVAVFFQVFVNLGQFCRQSRQTFLEPFSDYGGVDHDLFPHVLRHAAP